jgi:hypothetical protein
MSCQCLAEIFALRGKVVHSDLACSARGVKGHATAILAGLRDGPCDGEWPEERVERFQGWIETGMVE